MFRSASCWSRPACSAKTSWRALSPSRSGPRRHSGPCWWASTSPMRRRSRPTSRSRKASPSRRCRGSRSIPRCSRSCPSRWRASIAWCRWGNAATRCCWRWRSPATSPRSTPSAPPPAWSSTAWSRPKAPSRPASSAATAARKLSRRSSSAPSPRPGRQGRAAIPSSSWSIRSSPAPSKSGRPTSTCSRRRTCSASACASTAFSKPGRSCRASSRRRSPPASR